VLEDLLLYYIILYYILLGIVTLEDVLEELIGAWGGGGAALAEGASTHLHGRCSQAPRSSTRATCTPTT